MCVFRSTEIGLIHGFAASPQPGEIPASRSSSHFGPRGDASPQARDERTHRSQRPPGSPRGQAVAGQSRFPARTALGSVRTRGRSAAKDPGACGRRVAPGLRGVDPPGARDRRWSGHQGAGDQGRSGPDLGRGRWSEDPARTAGLLRGQQAERVCFDQQRPVGAASGPRPPARHRPAGLHRRSPRRDERRVDAHDQRRRAGQQAGSPQVRRREAVPRDRRRVTRTGNLEPVDRGNLAGRGEGPGQAGPRGGQEGGRDDPRTGPGRRQEPRGPADAGQARPQGHDADPGRRGSDHAQRAGGGPGSPVDRQGSRPPSPGRRRRTRADALGDRPPPDSRRRPPASLVRRRADGGWSRRPPDRPR